MDVEEGRKIRAKQGNINTQVTLAGVRLPHISDC